ncbi:MAG TPA: hypothetical protein VMY36_03705 [Patescibacteria group bacterium]|nr:hypothetical protein [Patescibacteria group bacterium]
MDDKEIKTNAILEQARLIRSDSVRQVAERPQRLLQENLTRAVDVLREAYIQRGQGQTEEDFQKKAREFRDYYDSALFDDIVHKTRQPLGEEVVPDSPICLASIQGKPVEELKQQSGQLDLEIGNLNYVFANCSALPSRSFALLDSVEKNCAVYQIASNDGHAVPLDIADVPLISPDMLNEYGEPIEGDFSDIDTVKLYYYARNIFTIDGFKEYFASYCTVFFDSPQNGIDFFRKYYSSIYQLKTLWVDEEVMKRWISSDTDFEVMKRMRDLMRNRNLIPPFCPEFQYKNEVAAKIKQ